MTYNNALKSCSHALNWTFTHPYPCSGSQQSYLSLPQDHYYTWQLTIKKFWRTPPPIKKKRSDKSEKYDQNDQISENSSPGSKVC